jgi:hypothetical protein
MKRAILRVQRMPEALWLLGVLVLFPLLSTGAQAQEPKERRLPAALGDPAGLRPSDGRVLVAQGVGTAEPAIEEVDVDAASPPPRDLTHEERLNMVAGLGLGLTLGTTTWRLTPAQAMITGLADLYFSQVAYIDLTSYEAPLAKMQRKGYGPYQSGRVRLRFQPPVSVTRKRYLIDCKVQSGPAYQVNVYPDGASQVFRNTSHLVVLYEAVSAGEAMVDMRLESSNDNREWGFYSCEITPLGP